MMKNYLTFLSFIAFVLTTNATLAQISVTNAIFPKVGDTLTVRPVLNFDGVDFTDAGADLFWNFEDISTGTKTSTFYLDPSEGADAADFPDAELMANTNGFGEIYYDVFNNRIDEIGRGGQDFGFGDLDIPLRFEKNPIFRRSPIDFGDVYDSESIASISISTDILPPELVAQVGVFADSIRVDLDINNSSSVDAWGTMSVPGGVYQVLREKVNTTQVTKLFFKGLLTQGAWLEASSTILAALGDLAEFFGEQNTVTYNFYSNTEKELIGSFTQDNTGSFVSGSVIGSQNIVSTKQLTYTENEINAYPNPSLGPITFDVGAFGNGEYRLTIFNIVGKQIHNDSFTVSGNNGYTTNLSNLRKGTYIYTIHNDKGDKLATKRFIILKP